MQRFFAVVLASLCPLGCSSGDSSGNGDVGSPEPMDARFGDLPPAEAGADLAPPDAGGTDLAPSSDGSTSCAPTPGTAMSQPGCDFLQLAIMRHTGQSTELVLTGRVYQPGQASCAIIDGVDILKGSTVVQHLDGGAEYLFDGHERVLGRGAPVAEIEGRCSSDDANDRFDMYGIIVKGRMNGGSFTASCAQAEGGSRWPPALRLTCHQNVEAPPENGNSLVTDYIINGNSSSSSQLYGNSPHGPGGALTTVNGTVRVIPKLHDPGPPVAAFDTTGWEGSAYESPDPPTSQLSLSIGADALGTTVCPPSSPMPTPTPRPVFLARVTGNGAHGAFSTEIFVPICSRSTIMH
jgi:hypothetical protein